MAFLPGSIVLKSVISQRYLRYVSDVDAPRFRFVEFAEESIWSPTVKFLVEKASVGNGSYVHLRSAYSKKYLRRSDDSPLSWIVADGDKKEEDTSQSSCTLFEPVKISTTDIRLRHVQLGNYTQLHRSSDDEFNLCMIAQSATPLANGDDVFIVTDSASLVPLPKYVAFKGDNGKYLIPNTEKHGIMQFVATDKGTEGVAHEILPTNDGYVRIKTTGEYNLTWEVVDMNVDMIFDIGLWVCSTEAGSEESLEANNGSLFQAVKVGDNVIALKNVFLDKFCTRSDVPDANISDSLLANGTSITEDAKLELEEAVLRRTLTVDFHTADARVYGLIPTVEATKHYENHEDVEVSTTITIGCTNDVTTTWEASDSWTVGVTTSISVDAIPFIANASVELSADYSQSYTWGKSESKGLAITDSTVYTVQKKHKLTVEIVATQGKCDVPFSYRQTDYLANGDIITTDKSDGVFKGVNCYDYSTKSYQDPLP